VVRLELGNQSAEAAPIWLTPNEKLWYNNLTRKPVILLNTVAHACGFIARLMASLLGSFDKCMADPYQTVECPTVPAQLKAQEYLKSLMNSIAGN
jgi:hypothetical protein